MEHLHKASRIYFVLFYTRHVSQINFNEVARKLQYSSNKIDAIYALLDLFGKHNIILNYGDLEVFRDYLPQDFVKWIDDHKDVNIAFDIHTINDKDVTFGDWDTIDL